MTPSDFRCLHRLRVRWAEVDMQKIVFNAHYLMYFDTAMADYWRGLAMPYDSAMQQLQGDLYVKKATVEYHASARMDDRLDVGLRCARIGNSSLTLQGAIFRGHELLITGELVYVFADPATQTSRPVPAPLRAMMQAYEAGETMLRVQTGSWAERGEDARPIRAAVFIDEQHIPPEDEWDAADAASLHAVAYNHLDQPVATARLLPSDGGVAWIGRVAVLPVLRGAGIGRAVLDTLVQAARARGDRELRLRAQTSAASFYRRAGLEVAGEPFQEAGIAHIEMRRAL